MELRFSPNQVHLASGWLVGWNGHLRQGPAKLGQVQVAAAQGPCGDHTGGVWGYRRGRNGSW